MGERLFWHPRELFVFGNRVFMADLRAGASGEIPGKTFFIVVPLSMFPVE